MCNLQVATVYNIDTNRRFVPQPTASEHGWASVVGPGLVCRITMSKQTWETGPAVIHLHYSNLLKTCGCATVNSPVTLVRTFQKTDMALGYSSHVIGMSYVTLVHWS